MVKVSFGGINYKVIDLTQPLILEAEVYPGDPAPKRKIFSAISETGWEHYIHEIGDHNFCPHGDAPKHQNPGAQDKGIESWGPEYFFTQACLIDLSGFGQEIDGVKYLIEVKKEHLEPFVEQLSKLEGVVIRTGYDKWLELNKAHVPENLPYLNKEAADYVASFDNLRVIGIDSLTVDPVGEHYSHQKFRGKFIVESLVHLDEIPQNVGEAFLLQTSPVRIIGATGGPVVAYAFVRN